MLAKEALRRGLSAVLAVLLLLRASFQHLKRHPNRLNEHWASS